MCLFCPVCLQETFMVIEKLFLSGRESSENKKVSERVNCVIIKKGKLFFSIILFFWT